MNRMVHAEYAGQHYEIPEAWLIGFCHGPARYTVFDAIAFWHHQRLSEDRFNAQLANRGDGVMQEGKGGTR